MQSNNEEIWKDVIGYDGIYKISNLGRLKSLDRGWRKGKIIKCAIGTTGYEFYYLSKNGNKKYMSIHRLVIEAFHGKSDLHIHHIDENKLNNKLSNLMYVTVRQNIHYSIKKDKSSSKFIGVKAYFNKWMASIYYNGYTYSIGIFDTEEEASFEYQKVVNKISLGTFKPKIKCIDFKAYYHKQSNMWQAYVLNFNKYEWVALCKTREAAIEKIIEKLYE